MSAGRESQGNESTMHEAPPRPSAGAHVSKKERDKMVRVGRGGYVNPCTHSLLQKNVVGGVMPGAAFTAPKP
jgi:hypothetical protein